MKIAVAADHAGFGYKDRIAQMLRAQGHDVTDFGTCDATPVDYPDYGFAVGEAVASGQAERGILVCGSSLGISIAANKVPGVRCVPVSEPYSTELSRRHNDANVLALSERLTGWEMIEQLVRIFIETPFDGGRHAERVAKLFEYTQEWKSRTLKAIESGEVTGAQTPKDLLTQ
ncbi:MAG: ribose 5-phosphate isomerase B [Vulcanimicrobiaceae bacterium]